MDWLELKIDTSPAGIDPVTALLEEQGVTGVIIDDARDFKDFMAHNQAYWDYVDDAGHRRPLRSCRLQQSVLHKELQRGRQHLQQHRGHA